MVLDSCQPREVFRFFEEISRIPRGSGNEGEIAQYLEDFALGRGLWVLRDGFNNVVIKKPGTPGFEAAPPVILQGHTDMVCEKNKDTVHDFEKDPIRLIAEGDFIRADGTTLGADNGIAVAISLALLDSKAIPHPPLEVVLTSGEEVGLTGAQGLDCSVLAGKTFFNLDSDTEGIFTVSCAGGLRADMLIPAERVPAKAGAKAFALRVKGLKGGHSGIEIDKHRANANVLLARALNMLAKEFDADVASVSGGLKINAIPREAEALVYAATEYQDDVFAAVDKLERAVKAEFATADPDVSISVAEIYTETGAEEKSRPALSKAARDRLISAIILTPNGVQSMSAEIAGLVKTSNNIGILEQRGDYIAVCNEVRSSSASEKNFVREKLTALAGLTGGTLEIHGDYPGWEYNPNSPMRVKLVRLYEEMYGGEPVVHAVHAGLECGFFAERIPGLDVISIGPDMHDIHTPDERLGIASTARVWEFLKKALTVV
ncbi:MAG: aminoacyl-histidine dipeptidase [Defluviitaleaceae bacterium]|nr:aminoacyl-histidine dipeptidase [Defluviitaleaceae bacterium]